MLGDFNDFPGRGLAERSLCPPLTATPELPTYPSRLPLLPLDRIWFSAPLELKTIATLRDAGRASDHLPLAREPVLAGRRRGGGWHGVCLDKSREFKRGPPEWVIPGGILGGRLQTL